MIHRKLALSTMSLTLVLIIQLFLFSFIWVVIEWNHAMWYTFIYSHFQLSSSIYRKYFYLFIEWFIDISDFHYFFYFLFIQVDAVDQQEREPLLEDGHGHGGLSLMFKNSHLKWWPLIQCAKWSKQHKALHSQLLAWHKSKSWRWFPMKCCKFVIFLLLFVLHFPLGLFSIKKNLIKKIKRNNLMRK